MHVLLAEDVEDTRAMMAEMLRQRGHQATLVTNGAEAVQLIESAPTPPFDVIVMDVIMPVMGGLTAVQRIRELPTGQALPILLITGVDYTYLQAWQTGADMMLRKPISLPVFIASVEKLASRSGRFLRRV